MHLMFSNEKNFKKMNIFLPFWSKSTSMWHISYYQWVQIIDSEAKRFQKKWKKY